MKSEIKRQTGYALLEALMSILVFSLGLIGIIGFQATAMKISSESQTRTEAALLADELIAQMSVSNFASLKTDFASSGTKYKAWYDNRLLKGSKLPNPTASVEIANGATSLTMSVRVCIDWETPGEKDDVGAGAGAACARTDSKPWKFQTTALLF